MANLYLNFNITRNFDEITSLSVVFVDRQTNFVARAVPRAHDDPRPRTEFTNVRLDQNHVQSNNAHNIDHAASHGAEPNHPTPR